LALWTALNAYREGFPKRQIRGFVGYAAQTSYQCDRFAEQFLTNPGLGDWKTRCKSRNENRYDSYFKNAVDEVSESTNLNVMLQYQDEFRMDGTQIRKISADFFETLDFNQQLHYPNFGKALQRQYDNFERSHLMGTLEDNVPSAQQFRGWFDFVDGRKVP
jgi:hypothetical protein